MKTFSVVRRVESCSRIALKPLALLACLVGLGALAWPSQAAVVGPGGSTNSFDVRPPATDWATKYLQGAQGDAYDLTNSIEALAATNMNVQLVDGGTADPATARANAFWTAGGGAYVATRPAANRCTLLMATLLNDSGTNAVGVHLRYDLGIKAASAEPDYPGLRAFYSLTGLSNSWVPIPEFSSPTPVAGTLMADLSFGVGATWPHGSNFYVLWADDNANNPSGSIQDPAYTLDNFFAAVSGGRPAGQPLGINLTSPTNNAWFFGPESVVLETDAVQDGTVVRVEFFVDGAKLGEATTSPYRWEWTQPTIGPHIVRAVITDVYASSQPSPVANLFVYDTIGSPFVRITTPTNGTVFAWPTNIMVSAYASAWDGVTNVTFLANGVVIGNALVPPYSIPWYAPFESSDLTVIAYGANGQGGTSPVANVFIQPPPTDLEPPTLAGQTPAAGSTITSLTAIQVVFSELVTNVKASDLLINGVPARSVTGSVSNYTFAVTQPAYGEVVVTWATNHIITDNGYPALLRFDGSAPGASWTYTLIDRTAPTIYTRSPAAGSASLTLTEATLTFSEPVTGVDASDFLLNGLPATSMTGSGSNYTFYFDQPPLGAVAITWAANHGIVDSATPPNAFDASAAGATWSYTVGIPMQTGNDNFADRITLVGTPVQVMGSNVGTSTENGEPTGRGFSRYGNTVWWTWTAPANGMVRMDTFGSSFNTELGVFTGSAVNALQQIAFNDNAPGSSDVSLVTFTAVEGTQYQIQVSGAAGFGFPQPPPASGTIRLNLSMPPSITLLSPTNGAVYLAGQDIPLAAAASAQSGSVKQIDFYCAGSLAASVVQAPFEAILANAPSGSNAVHAVVTDSSGQVATSAVVRILVANVGVTITSPADGTVFANNNPVTVGTVTLLPSGSITNVAFFVDGEKFAEDDLAPFSAAWSTLTGGSHRLLAVGRADTGESFTSQTVYIGVAQLLVQSNAAWKYLDNGSDQGTAWQAPGFDDSSWSNGVAQFGYGDGDEATVVASGPSGNVYPTTYFRHAFAASNAASFAGLQFYIQRDDGAVVYLNGAEIFRLNMGTGIVTYTNWASNADDDGAGFISVATPANLLVEGNNELAVEIHQTSATSTDISFNLQLLGVPRIIRNQAPTVALTSPTNLASFLVPTDVTLAVAATDKDGTVAKVEFFLDGTKLGEATNPPYALILQNVPAGIYTFTAAATDNMGATAVSAPSTIHVYEVGSRWVAYNDHYAGPGTHPNATAWNVFGTVGGAPGDEGALRNIATGASLPAFLTLMEFGAFADPVCGTPAPGTPAYADFNGFVDFGSGGLSHAILVTQDSLVMHLFTGLDPLRRYRLRATVVGGLAGSSNRWTLCTLGGATSFTPAHTPNVLTTATQPALAADEAAFNSGDNRSGDVVGWDNIAPGPDGSFMVLSTQYLGPAPGNDQPGLAAYAPVAVRLEETAALPFVRVTAPLDGAVITGPTNVILAAEASSLRGIVSISFIADGLLLGTTAGQLGSLVWTNPSFADHMVTATTLDAQGLSTTSAPVTLHLVTPPTNTISPYLAAQVPAADSTVTNLTKVQVVFSQTVVGVDAVDLLVNGVAATNVTGTGSNYTFFFPQPAYGAVAFTWATNAAIHDLSWPDNLPFYDSNPDNYWSYALIDRTPPTVVGRSPAAGSTLTNLTQISVTFSEPVDGVTAGDLLVNGIPAYGLTGGGVNYSFTVSQPPSGTISITWAANHGITDQAVTPNPFNATNTGATWTYTLDARTILVASNAAWMFVKGTNEASTPTNAWRQVGFDDSGWSNAPAPFFYGDPYSNGVPAYTLLSDMRSNYTCIFLRHTLFLPKASTLTNLLLSAQSDDGFIAWINGVEVARYNMPAGEVAYTGVSSSTSPEPQNAGAGWLNYTLPNPSGYLVNGTNVLTIQAFNESLTTSSDFGFNAQLYTYTADTEAVAPRLASKVPAAGYLFELTNVLVTFTEPVTNVEAADLLINGQPASALTSESNTVFLFSFPQPPYGVVAMTWASNHGIVDLDITPKPFSEAVAGSTWQYILLNPNSPYLTAVSPTNGTSLNELTQLFITFNEPVTGVDAGDLLVNGVPATGVAGSGTDYTFTFAQPAYGSVAIGWALQHGITDLSQPPESFDAAWPNHAWNYTLVDKTPPFVAAQNPPAGAAVANLTQLSVTFSEAVSGVNASDLLINGKAASTVTGSNALYTFTFAQPNAAVITVAWATGHGIRDLATSPNNFDATAPGATWSYETVDNVPPSLVTVVPAPAATIRSLRQVSVTFDEPVQGVGAQTLTLNGTPAETVSGTGAGPYAFGFTQPATGVVQIALSAAIQDLAATPNAYRGSNWTCVLNPNLPPPAITRGPYLQVQTTNSIIVRWRTGTATDSSVQFGLDLESRTNVISDLTTTTEHIVTVSNLTANTTYFYAVGTSDGGLVASTNYYFRTAPPIGGEGPTRIWFISDYGFKDSGEASVRNFYFNYVAPVKPADVWLTGGDNDQTDGADANYQNAVFGSTYAYSNLIRTLPVWTAMGNHDYQTSQGVNYYANFSMPTNGEAGGVPSGTKHYYSHDYNNIHFVDLDSIEQADSISSTTAMAQWLRQDLAATTQKWIIAHWHGPAYTKGTHDSDSTSDTLSWMVQMRENIVPILEAYGVDLVLCGHSHVYERSWLLNGHYGYSTSFSQTNKLDGGDGKTEGTGAYVKPLRGLGTVYVTAAVGGQPQSDRFPGVPHPAHLLKIANTFGSLLIDVQGDQLDFQFVGTNNNVLDHFTMSKTLPTAAPDAPTGLLATKSNETQVLLSWDNTPTNELRFVLERSTDGRNFAPIATIGANLTNYTDTSLPPVPVLFYRLSAVNTAGTSEYSGTTQVRATSLRIVNTGESLVVSWPASAVGYQLQVSPTLGQTANWQNISAELIRTNGFDKEFDFWPAQDAPKSFFRLKK